MKAKVVRGAGFSGLVAYAADADKNAERVGGSLALGGPKQLVREFVALRALRPDVDKPVWHCALSLPPGERIDNEKWEAVARAFLEKMGFDLYNTGWAAFRHHDTDKDHIHIIASRIQLDGKLWLGKWEAKKAIEATQELEREFGLTQTKGLSEARAERRKPSFNEIQQSVRTGEAPPRVLLQDAIDRAVGQGCSLVDLVQRLDAAGVGVQVHMASTGRVQGLSFELQGQVFKGSALGKAYGWGGIQQKGVTYDQDRDRGALERLAEPGLPRRAEQPAARASEPREFGRFDSIGDRFAGIWRVPEPNAGQFAGLATAPRLLGVPQLPGFSLVRRPGVGAELLPGTQDEDLLRRQPGFDHELRRKTPGDIHRSGGPVVAAESAGTSTAPNPPAQAQPAPSASPAPPPGGGGDVSDIRADRGYVAMQMASVRAAFGSGPSKPIIWPVSVDRMSAADLAAERARIQRRKLQLEAAEVMRQQRGKPAPVQAPSPAALARAKRDLPSLRTRAERAQAQALQLKAAAAAVPWYRPFKSRRLQREAAAALTAASAAIAQHRQAVAIVRAPGLIEAQKQAAERASAERAERAAIEQRLAEITAAERHQQRGAERRRITESVTATAHEVQKKAGLQQPRQRT